jgi:hypothetical protein
MTLYDLLQQIEQQPEMIEFNQVIEVIENNYLYQPATFTNGLGTEKQHNPAGSNEGSCKIFSFGQLNKLDEDQVLACFGRYYREDVLQHPDANDHGNIRAFMKHGWLGIQFESPALTPR